MAFTLWTLFEATILFLNAVCVLHEERFLAKSEITFKFKLFPYLKPSTFFRLVGLIYFGHFLISLYCFTCLRGIYECGNSFYCIKL